MDQLELTPGAEPQWPRGKLTLLRGYQAVTGERFAADELLLVLPPLRFVKERLDEVWPRVKAVRGFYILEARPDYEPKTRALLRFMVDRLRSREDPVEPHELLEEILEGWTYTGPGGTELRREVSYHHPRNGCGESSIASWRRNSTELTCGVCGKAITAIEHNRFRELLTPEFVEGLFKYID